MIKKLQNHQGFTLIEVLVSLMIIGIIAVTIMGLFTSSIQNNMASKDKMEGAILAKNMMEKIKIQISSEHIIDFSDLNSIAADIQSQYAKSTVTITEKDIDKKLYTIQIDVPGVKKGTTETFISHMYVPYGSDE